MIAMGMEGIRNKIEGEEHSTGNISSKDLSTKVWDKRFLPKSMYEALAEAEGSSFLRQTLGDETYQNYMTLKIQEWEGHRTHVTHRELSMYLDR